MLCIINTIQASAIKYGEDGRSTSSWIATRISPAAEKLISSRSPEKVVGFVTRSPPRYPAFPETKPLVRSVNRAMYVDGYPYHRWTYIDISSLPVGTTPSTG